jgi:hypothetical protein
MQTTEILNIQLPQKLEIECRREVNSPFYTRWLNRFGGIDYWMFEKRQTIIRKLENYADVAPSISDYSAAAGSNYVFFKEAGEKIVAGAECLNANEWFELSRMQYSPLIQYLDERSGQWIDIMIDKCEALMNSGLVLHSIELTFIMPQTKLQF